MLPLNSALIFIGTNQEKKCEANRRRPKLENRETGKTDALSISELFFALQDDPSQDIFYAYNNIIINGVGTQGFEHHQSYILENLIPNSMYEAQIQAKNQYGWSSVSDKFQFFTRGYGEFSLQTFP